MTIASEMLKAKLNQDANPTDYTIISSKTLQESRFYDETDMIIQDNDKFFMLRFKQTMQGDCGCHPIDKTNWDLEVYEGERTTKSKFRRLE